MLVRRRQPLLSLAVVQIVIGFLIADRLELSAEAAAGAIGLALLVVGVILVGVQGVLVPRLGWTAVRLVRVGAPTATLAFAVLTFAPTLATIIAALALLALGLGLAMPGYTAAPTMLVGPAQQGAVAGMINATNGTTFIIGPVLGTALYEVSSIAPVLLSLLACTIAFGLALLPLSSDPDGRGAA